MYKTKRDIDKHVELLKSKLTLKEFNSRAYSFARLYFDVGDYTNCQKYVEQYMSQKDNNAAAHKLLGQTLRKLGDKEKAFDHYRTSFDINPTQTDLLLDICDLLSEDDISVDSGIAKYWCEKAEATFPKNPVTFKLREKLLAGADPDPEALMKLLKSELVSRPRDASLHSRLLKHYLTINKISEAFEHSLNVEFSDNNFSNTFAWYETLAEILKNNALNPKEWKYQLLFLTAKERLCLLSLTETPSGNSKSLKESCEFLHQYDQALQYICQVGPPADSTEFHKSLIQHHQGQLTFHAATYLLKKAKKDQLNWKEASKYAAPLMLMAWHSVLLDSKVNWLNHVSDIQKVSVKRWYLEGSYRCSQSGHYLVTNIQEKGQAFLDNVGQLCTGKDWREKFYDKIFPTHNHKVKKMTSYFQSESVNPPSARLPKKSEVEKYDADAQRYYANSLHHNVWILLNYKHFENFKLNLFDMLPTKTSSYQSCGPENLNKLDVLAFLYFATFTVQQGSDQQYGSADRPSILPANITDLLCPSAQMKWWDCAYKLSQNTLGTELTDIRLILARGIEVVRCIDNHGLDPEMLCKAARVFTNICKTASGNDTKACFEGRANLYYSAALGLLEKIRNKYTIRVSDKRMFDYTHKEMSNKDLNKLIEECQISVAVRLVNESEFEEAVELLSKIKSPRAYFHLSDAYMKIAKGERNSSIDFSRPDSKAKIATVLFKAKSYAYKTLDKLKETHNYTNDTLFSETEKLIENIEVEINSLNMDFSETVMEDTQTHYSSDENGSVHGIDYLTRRSNSHYCNISSTPKQSANQNLTNYRTAVDSQIFENSRVDYRSLERIENQIKSLQKRDSTVNSFIEQTKSWFEDNRDLVKLIGTINANVQNTTDQFKLLKISVDQVKDQVDECRKECKDVGELKKQISELKKEVQKLKKGTSEQAVDESDVYSIDDEYRANDNTSAFSPQISFNPAHLVPSLNQRLIPPFTVPPNPYQLYGQNMYNLYNQFAQTPPTGPPLFDPSRPPVNYSQMFATPEQLYQDMSHFLPASVAQVTPLVSIPSIPSMPPVPSVQPMMTKPPAVPASVTMSTPPVASINIPKPAPTILSKDNTKALPVNVVITSSDPLPTATSVPQPVLSVTIPPKHIKGSPHNYQITMPPTSDAQTAPTIFGSTASGDANAKPFSSWNQNISFKVTDSPTTKDNTSIGQSPFSLSNAKPQPLDNSVTVVDGSLNQFVSPNNSMNKSRTLSEKSNTSVEYDPCPDFKPIIPLPDEVKVTTGEENETPVFSARAKLYRFADKQWKERGLGELKLLKHKETQKVRVLMRREQIHKICANHIITADMEINPMKNETKAYIWVANDFADEAMVLEKFCVRFKTPEIAKEFYDSFEKARKECVAKTTPKSESKIIVKTSSTNDSELNKYDNKAGKEKENEKKKDADITAAKDNKNTIGGFTFSSTPNFKLTEKHEPKSVTEDSNKVNPFSNVNLKSNSNNSFSALFNLTNPVNTSVPKTSEESANLNSSDTVEEFEPNVDFKPVVPLPALVEQKTGEEDETVLFEHRSKLLRFVTTKDGKEWKERGLGIMKLLVNKDNSQKIRLLMRREQVMKVCCNHALTKEMVFEKMPKMPTAVTWCAQDFSEGELTPETFCLRFKSDKICDDFIKAVKSAQSKLTEDTKAAKEEQNAAKQTSESGFGDKFKPKPGSWQCNDCYTNNLENFTNCACCEKAKPGSATEKKIETLSKSGWGDQFKPKPGSWECKNCFVRNEENIKQCTACNSLKDPTTIPQNNNQSTNATVKFSFGQTPNKVSTETKSTVPIASAGWGDKFKPKSGSWECKQCLLRNDESKDECCACNSPKDPNAPKKESKSIFDTATTVKFSYGIPSSTVTSTTNTEVKSTADNTVSDGSSNLKFKFGIPSSTPTVFGTPNQQVGSGLWSFATAKKTDEPTALNFSVNKNEDSNLNIKAPLLQTPLKGPGVGSNESSSFDFVFKPKSPVKGKSPMKSPKSEKADSDNEYASEDEGHHIHFNPIIPLPDKVEVVTGEENEEVLYEHRAKLFRFVSKEWKERGLGVIKILKHKESKKLRVVMRREQVLKICLNHALTKDITYTAKEDKAWLFTANDFSEGELNLQQFCIRFKNKEIAQEFKNAIEKARGGVVENSDKTEADNDVVFVSEIQASVEDKKRAKELMLPENFFTYKDKESCQGCRGCTDDDDDNEKQDKIASTPTKTQSPVYQSPQMSFYGTPMNFNKTADASIFRTPLESANTNASKLSSTSSSSYKSAFEKENKSTPTNTTDNLFEGLGGTKSAFEGSLAKPNFGANSNVKSGILAAPKLSSATIESKESLEPKSLFGGAQSKFSFGGTGGTSENKPLFGTAPATNVKPATTSIFGNANSASSDKPLFGSLLNSSAEPQNAGSKSIFGGESKTESIFSGAPGSLFGPASTNKPVGSGFDKSTFGSSVVGFGSGKSVFGLPANQSAANENPKTNNEASNLFSQAIQANQPAQTGNSETTGNDTKEQTPFKVDNILSFADLSSKTPAFNDQKKTDFTWEGAGQQLFGVNKAKNMNTSRNESGVEEADEQASGADDGYDPHYEPIVPLPDKIEVTTGEEDEEILFGERSKLYRFEDQTKEWKERGVGQLKILYHPEKKTYRLILRRDQVYKVVLNMLLHIDFELLPMNKSNCAWTWAAQNFVDGESCQETLAVKFKNAALATTFKDKVVECVRKLQAAAAQSIRDGTENQDNKTEGKAPLRLPKHLEDSARADPGMTMLANQLVNKMNTTSGNSRTNGQSSPKVEVKAVNFEQEADHADDEHDDEENYDEYEGYYENEEDDSALYYECEGDVVVEQNGSSVTCADCHVQVMYDQSVYSPKIVIMDPSTGEILVDMLIHTDTDFKMSEDSCTWSGLDYTSNEPTDRTVTVNFPDSDTAMMFYDSCETSKAATYASDPQSS